MVANLLASLEIMLWGMIGIFVIIGLIFATTLILSIISAKSAKKAAESDNE